MVAIIMILSIGVIISETIAAIAGISQHRKLSDSLWSYLTYYLIWICTLEWIGWLSRLWNKMDFNSRLYNYVSIPSEYLFFLWLLSQLIRSRKQKVLVVPEYSILIYVIAWFFDHFYFSKQTYTFQSFSVTVGSILMVVLIIVYLYQIVASDYILSFAKTIEFWVILGIISYYLLSLPYYGTYNTLTQNYKHIFEIYQVIVYCLSICMYLLFTVGFLWPKKS